ncbi:haloacid dehalogenase superfamily, subfamily IA, variant 3 with third motif having DD or ED [Micromonospora citrea]|uniref:Haloacid dehalogenase superfamily, subfamily IA, variant 3 with third motif having DD or ED n=1 Tax=Micromonospora citrea TaxID=47855 RepID=A0A1C6V5Y4_9ACTN|nr:HAD family phosphatase [Micromonospora citrea]SCL61779.1 haloacid dehalogenase superfamily, subfamily IA, variant 3 with third motif having DD or ED [Micromonospora citrea]
MLLDFDGPVCNIFANYPAPQVAAELVDVLRRCGVDVPPELASEPDPLEVLRRAAVVGDRRVTEAVEDALCSAECRAVKTAEPTPFGREVIVAARQSGMSVAVVSNNSAGAVSAYLMAHRLAAHVSPVIGRSYADPDRMKPSPEPILQAVRAVGEPAHRCVLIGDSPSDIAGSLAAGVKVIGYANKAAKADSLRVAGADAVVDTVREIVDRLLLA